MVTPMHQHKSIHLDNMYMLKLKSHGEKGKYGENT